MKVCCLLTEPPYEGSAIKQKSQKNENQTTGGWLYSGGQGTLGSSLSATYTGFQNVLISLLALLTLQIPIIWDSGNHQHLPCLASTVRDLFCSSNDDKLTQQVPGAVNNGPSGPSSDDSEPKQYSQCLLYKKQGVSQDD